MIPFKKALTICMVLCLCFVSNSCKQHQSQANLIIQAEVANRQIPVLSIIYPAMDVNEAYDVQKAYIDIKLNNESIVGYKAGLTSTSLQEKFGIRESVAGVLFESGKLSDNVIVDSKDYKKLMLETEIGFIIGKSISQSIPNVDELRKHIKAVALLLSFLN